MYVYICSKRKIFARKMTSLILCSTASYCSIRCLRLALVYVLYLQNQPRAATHCIKSIRTYLRMDVEPNTERHESPLCLPSRLIQYTLDRIDPVNFCIRIHEALLSLDLRTKDSIKPSICFEKKERKI